MDDGIEIIHTHPFSVFCSFYMPWVEFKLSPETSFDIAGYPSHLGGGIALTDNEKIGRGIFQCSQIKYNNIFPLNICDAIYNQIRRPSDTAFALMAFLALTKCSLFN